MLTLLILLAFAPQQNDSTAFVRRMVAAINSHSAAARRALQHPKDAACETTSFTETIVERQARYSVPGDYKWHLTAARAGALPFAAMVTYAVRPTHQLQIDFSSAPLSQNSIILSVVHDASGWHEVFGCPTKQTLAKLESAKQAGRRQKEEVARRLNELPRVVRDSMLALDANGRNVSALAYYVSTTTIDKTVASMVLDSLLARHRLKYKWEYKYNTPDLREDHFIVLDTIDNNVRGWYYGTTDDFDSAREGYKPGFFVLPMSTLRSGNGAITFSLTVDASQIYTTPIAPTVRDPRQYRGFYREWSVVPLQGRRDYIGTVSGDSIVLKAGRDVRVFRRLR